MSFAKETEIEHFDDIHIRIKIIPCSKLFSVIYGLITNPAY